MSSVISRVIGFDSVPATSCQPAAAAAENSLRRILRLPRGFAEFEREHRLFMHGECLFAVKQMRQIQCHTAIVSKLRKVNVGLYSAILWNGGTSNAVVSSVFGRDGFSSPAWNVQFRLDGRITQRIGQWVPNRWTGDWESPGAKCAATKPWNIRSRERAVRSNFWPEASK